MKDFKITFSIKTKFDANDDVVNYVNSVAEAITELQKHYSEEEINSITKIEQIIY